MSMWVLDETGSATIFASVLAISIVPTILLSPFGGVLADRVNRRTIMVALDAISAVLVLADVYKRQALTVLRRVSSSVRWVTMRNC